MLLLSLATAAWAGTTAITAGGGYDFITAQPWAGLDLAQHPTNDHGFAPLGRLTAMYGFADDAPLASLELGGAFVIPNDSAIVRFGALFKGDAIYTEYPAAVRPFGEGTDGAPVLGFLPGGMLIAEFEWGDVAPFTIRIAGGTMSQAGAAQCSPTDVKFECVTWSGGFIGGLEARYRAKNGLFAEAWAGPSPSLTVGYAFGKTREPQAPEDTE